MLTWAYVWFATRPSIREYMPLLFIITVCADATILIQVAQAFGRVCK